MRLRRVLVSGSMVALVGLLAIDVLPSAGAQGSVRACAVVHASVPYSHHGSQYRWRVYVAGATTCRSGQAALNAVMHLNAAAHEGTSNANSYFTYKSWTCDFGQMGEEACRKPGQRPYKAGALALNCSTPATGCPLAVPRRDLP